MITFTCEICGITVTEADDDGGWSRGRLVVNSSGVLLATGPRCWRCMLGSLAAFAEQVRAGALIEMTATCDATAAAEITEAVAYYRDALRRREFAESQP
jgi:hypothetical protein